MLRARALLALLVACGGPSTPAPTQPTPPTPTPAPTPPTPTPTPTPEPPKPAVVQHDPEFYPPAWKKVGVGQTVYLSTAVIDQDLEETAVTVTKLPASAKFDAITQTITWTPAKSEIG